MELIKEIYDRDLLIESTVKSEIRYRLRRAARGLIFLDKNIAVLNAKNLNLHKLPGGGLEGYESADEALKREVIEETGCKIAQISEFGMVIEYRREIELIQVSYVFTASVADNSLQPVLTQKEKDEGFVLEWMSAEDAFDFMKNKDRPSSYAGKFIRARDMSILDYYLRKK